LRAPLQTSTIRQAIAGQDWFSPARPSTPRAGSPMPCYRSLSAYDLATGKFIGLVQDATGKTLSVSGLWALSPGNSAAAGSYDPAGSRGSELYFTAGPNHGTGGLFGYLKPVSTELTVGNDQ
jgi:hypothetical protein